jgi:class 3 adenylate cyclase
METSYRDYNPLTSKNRVQKILNGTEFSYEESDSIPAISSLTYYNGFYVKCGALFIDIRDSTTLTDDHTRPKLAKLYRAYISEIVAILNGNAYCRHVDIIGDGILGIFEGALKVHTQSIFLTACTIGSFITFLNKEFKKNSIIEIKVGIGLSIGRALMIKTGYNGSGINDLSWVGDVINEACNLGNLKNSNYFVHEVRVTDYFYDNLTDNQKRLLSFDSLNNCWRNSVYESSVIYE